VSDCDSQATLATKNSCGKVHAAQDPVEIANAMIWFVQNPGELHTMGRNGFNVVREKYAIDGVESALVNLYRSLSD
jgi:glycosyltransferase involved in cell wall biosynthesis